nr:isochorismatase family cysteine hydrolase [Desulfuromonas sp. KJ2020]
MIIDMLNDFVRTGAALEVPKTRLILPDLQARLHQARAAGVPVVFVCDAHAADDREFERMGWPPHAVRGSEGAQIVTELSPLPGEAVVEKTTYSGFYQTELESVLTDLEAQELVLTGCVTNICIFYTAADAVMRGYQVRVPRQLVADIEAADGRFALEQMDKVLGVTVE